MRRFKKTTKKQLGQLLIERGVINHDQLNKAIEYQGNNGGLIGEVLVDLKHATENDIAQAITCQYGFPFLPLDNYDIEESILNLISEEVCRDNSLIPIDKIGNSITVAMANPLNIKAAEAVEKITGCTVQTFVSTASDVKKTIDKHYKKE